MRHLEIKANRVTNQKQQTCKKNNKELNNTEQIKLNKFAK